MRLLYFHGLGLSSYPEDKLLTQHFIANGLKPIFWSAPSVLRRNGDTRTSDDAYHKYLASSESFFLKHTGTDKVVVAGHSFGAHLVLHLAARYPDKIAACVFLASFLAIPEAPIHLLTTIKEDFRQHGDDRHLQIAEVLQHYTGKFDDHAERGFELLFQNERLLGYYWCDHEKMMQFIELLNGEVDLDVEGFMAVMRTWVPIACTSCQVPAMAILGKHDPYGSNHLEKEILSRIFTSLRVHELDASGHFPQFEETDNVMRLIREVVL